MPQLRTHAAATAALLALLSAASATAQSATYDVTVTNLTRGQRFTPLLVVSHRAPSGLFVPGMPAQPGLVTLAEEGDIGPLSDVFAARRDVNDIATNGGLLDPGASVTIPIEVRGPRELITVAAMLIPTNDAFVAVMDVAAPQPGRRVVLRALAYDAGSERNDETCDSIPGPFFAECAGPGDGGRPGNGEGYVHVHAGIHGSGDFEPADRDWRNPVAEIVISHAQ